MQGKGKLSMEISKSNNFEDFPAYKICMINNAFFKVFKVANALMHKMKEKTNGLKEIRYATNILQLVF